MVLQVRARALLLGLTISVLPAVAHADDVDRCVGASERGQEARKKKQFQSARQAFVECSSDKCPAVIRSTCAEWLEQVNQSEPSIVVAVAAPDGTDVTRAKLLVDGKTVALGSTTALEPGVHRIDVEADGYDAASMPFIAREGEKNRTVRITLSPMKKEAQKSKPKEDSPDRTVTWVSGGLAFVALGGFLALGLTGASRASELRTECGPTCPSNDKSEVQTRYLLADLSLVAAVVLGGVSIYTLVTSR